MAIFDYEKIVRLLLNEKADINARDRTGYSALRLAIEKENETIVRLLMNEKADMNAINVSEIRRCIL